MRRGGREEGGREGKREEGRDGESIRNEKEAGGRQKRGRGKERNNLFLARIQRNPIPPLTNMICSQLPTAREITNKLSITGRWVNDLLKTN